MTKLTLKNSLGEAVMAGGGNSHIRLTALSGLEFVPKSYGTVKFSETDGIQTVTDVHTERTITGKGDIFFTSDEEIKKLYSVFLKKGEIFLTSKGKSYKCGYKPSKFETEKQGNHVVSFVFQIICDSPYFLPYRSEKKDIYKRQDMINGDVTLPAVFTARETKTYVVNKGHKKCEPTINLYYAKDLEGTSDNGVIIKNATTGQFIKFNGKVKDYGSVAVNVSQRKAYAGSGEDISRLLSNDTYLSEFFIETGSNEIEILNNNLSESIYADIEYCPLYLGV